MSMQALNHLESLRGKMSLDALRTERSNTTSGAGFAEHLEKAFNDTSTTLQQADAAATSMAIGEPTAGLHETMIAVEKADIAFRAFTAVKSRAVEAYQEIMRMQM